MFEELAELLFPGGALVAFGVGIGAAFGQQLRPVAKQVVKGGMVAASRLQEFAAEAYEQGQDLVAEARQEVEHENGARGAADIVTPSSSASEASSRSRRSSSSVPPKA